MSTAGNPEANAINSIRRSCFAVKYSRGSLNADLAPVVLPPGARDDEPGATLIDVDDFNRSAGVWGRDALERSSPLESGLEV